MRQHIHMSQAPSGRQLMVTTVDYHTEGEPFRIVSGGVPPLVGRSILEKRRYALEHLDHIRQLLVFEPRGHADMYGGFVTEPEDDGAQLGVVFFHNAGYSTACGHGTIALVTWAIEAAIVPAGGSTVEVVVDVPSGRLVTVATMQQGRVQSVRFRNVPSFVLFDNLRVALETRVLEVAVAYGCSGPVLQASGVPMDPRKDEPYEKYGEVEFDVPIAVPSTRLFRPTDLRCRSSRRSFHGSSSWDVRSKPRSRRSNRSSIRSSRTSRGFTG